MKIKFKTLFIQLFIFLVLGEIGSRIILPSHQSAENLHFNTVELDEEVGWKVKSNHHFIDTVKDNAGKKYIVDFQTQEGGLKKINTIVPDTIEQKVLFIGDSYTIAVEVSNEKTFYGLLEKRMPIEVYAYGAGGYSTLQKLLMFEKLVDQVKPDLVVWQFCSNDFIDNYPELEMEANYKIGVRRPYWTLDHKIEYRTPIPSLLQWSRYSKLVYAIYLIKEKTKTKFSENQKPAEQKIAELHFEYQHYKNAYDITGKLLKKIKESIPPNIPFLVFPADAFNPQMEDYIQLCRTHKIDYEISVAKKLNEARFGRKEEIFTYDGWHWNERGHEVVADALEDRIRELLMNN